MKKICELVQNAIYMVLLCLECNLWSVIYLCIYKECNLWSVIYLCIYKECNLWSVIYLCVYKECNLWYYLCCGLSHIDIFVGCCLTTRF